MATTHAYIMIKVVESQAKAHLLLAKSVAPVLIRYNCWKIDDMILNSPASAKQT